MTNRLAARAIEIAVIIVSTAAGILGVKSVTESILYLQPFSLRVAKNSYAFVADIVMLIISLPFAVLIDGKIGKLKEKMNIN